MINCTLALLISIILAAGPAAASVVEAAVGRKGGPTSAGAQAASNDLPSLPSATLGLMTSPAFSVISAIESAAAQPESLRALAADASPAAVYARALIAANASPAARAEAVKSLGADAVARLETAVHDLALETAGSVKAAGTLKVVAGEFEALGSRAPEAFANTDAASNRAQSKGRRAWNRLKRYTMTATAALMLSAPVPSLAAPIFEHDLDRHTPRQQGQTYERTQPAPAAHGQYISAPDLHSALRQWNKDVKIYLIGNPNIDAAKLNQMAAFLNDKPWVVVIVQNQDGLSYRAPDGRTYHGYEAVEWAVNQGFFAKIDSVATEDQLTGKREGAAFGVVIEQRKTHFRGSPKMRELGLAVAPGESGRRWSGDLENLARPGLRNGLDVATAVTDTYNQLNKMMNEAVANMTASSQGTVAAAKRAVDALARARAEFAKNHPQAAAQTFIDVAALQAKIARADALLSAKPREAAQAVSGVADQANAAVRAINDFKSSYAEASRRIAQTKAEVAQAELAVADFHKKHPRAAGDTVHPDVKGWRDRLAAAENQLEINPSLSVSALRSIESQANAAVSAISAFNSAYADAVRSLASAKTELALAESAVADFQRKHPHAAGDVARPDVRGWRERLATAERQMGVNPAESARALRSIQSLSATAKVAIADFAFGQERIKTAQERYTEIAKRPYAGSAAADLNAANDNLRDAKSLYDNGESGYAPRLALAVRNLNEAERQIAAAVKDAAEHERNMLIGLILLGLLTLGIGLAMNLLLVKPVRVRLEEGLQPWDKRFKVIDDAVIDNLDKWLEKNAKAGWQEKTGDLVKQIQQDAGAADLRRDAMRKIYNQMNNLARPSFFSWRVYRRLFNLVVPWNLNTAEKLLTGKTEVEVTLESRAKNWKADLFGPIENFKPLKMSFTEVVTEHDAYAKAAVDAMERIEKARADAPTLTKTTEEAIAKASAAKPTLEHADGQFQAKALFDAAMPVASAKLAEALSTKDNDPVGALEGGGSEAKRIASDIQTLAEAIVAARSGALAQTEIAAAELTAAGVENGWISEERARLSAQSDGVAAAVATTSAAPLIAALVAGFEAFAQKTAKALEGAKALAEARARVAKGESVVAQARRTIGEKLGLSPADMLTEENANPSDEIAKAVAAIALASTALNAGLLEEAGKNHAEVTRALNTASGITAASLKSLEANAQTADARRAETDALKALEPERQAVLESIQRDFVASVLKLTSGDATHPNADGTVSNNIDEANISIAAADAKQARAREAFLKGRLLSAANLLDQAHAHNEIAQDRLDEISEKRQRLDAAVAANAQTSGSLQQRAAGYEKTVTGDGRASAATVKAFDKAKDLLVQTVRTVETAKSDPFQAQTALAAVGGAFDKVWSSALNDFEAHAEVVRSLKAARVQLDEAQRLKKAADGDGVTDSGNIERAKIALTKLEADYRKTEQESQITIGPKAVRGDWPSADREADRITADAARTATLLKNELKIATEAINAISDASEKARQAANWSGDYNVRVTGSPGSNEVNRARQAINSGDYTGALRYAEAARRESASAVAAAIAMVESYRRAEAQRRREEQEAREERDRQEEAQRRRSSDSSSSSSGGYSGSSSSGGGYSSGGDSGSFSSGSSSSGGDSGTF